MPIYNTIVMFELLPCQFKASKPGNYLASLEHERQVGTDMIQDKNFPHTEI